MEIWKEIPGFEGRYEVSTEGRVRSLDRPVARSDGRVHKAKGRLLTPKPNVGGYPSLRLGRDNPVMVHQLMALTFLGPPNGRYVCHNDGTRANNTISNIRYDSPKSNQEDRVTHGTAVFGARSYLAKLTQAQAAEIKRRARHTSYAELGREFGVSGAAVRLIALGINWRRALEKE